MAQVIEDKYILGQSTSAQIQSAGEEVNLDLILQPNSNTATGGTITGTLTNTNGNTPISGAYVKLMSTSYVPIMHAITDSNGNYSLTNVPAGTYYIFSAAPNMSLGAGTQIVVSNFGVYTQPLTLTQNPNALLGVIAGIVTNETTGDPIANAMVSLSQAGSTGSSQIGVTYTNQYGQYTFREVPIGQYSVTISNTGYQTLTTSVQISKASQIVPLKQQLIPTSPASADSGTVSGVITDSTKAPVANADVILYSVTPGSGGSNTLTPVAYTQTNSNGVYLFGGLPTGSYIVKANEVELVNVTV
ncbi:MSCRAMM family protein [Clostridium massiliodielmoense]|uniref:MSCRAMM family protein n=1 Tax=Clostridium massiliodielmoense TaxID=1776385 RepID=UPI000A2724F9|nr:carboxypeptidase regulatory-like domain-containing protein [Clostridium massiliodielmoense]